MSTAGPTEPAPIKRFPNDAAHLPLYLSYDNQEPLSGKRIAVAVTGAALYHVLAFGFLVFAPAPPPLRRTRIEEEIARAVPLYVPKELTQRDPNRGLVSHQLDVRSAAPSAAVASVRIPPPPILIPTPAPAQIAPPQVNVPEPPKPAPVPPKVEQTPPPPSAGKPPDRPSPPPPLDKPKLSFEAVGAGGTAARASVDPGVKVPEIDTSIDSVVRAIAPPPSAPGSVVVGDKDASRLQLLSDPGGVDFKPYLITVLTAVRNNWLTIIPESARLGRRGRVLVQFIIDKRGRIPKIVIAEESGTAAFDRAAIDGVNRSVPFPPLPSGYSGNEIRLQLAFTYNPAAR